MLLKILLFAKKEQTKTISITHQTLCDHWDSGEFSGFILFHALPRSNYTVLFLLYISTLNDLVWLFVCRIFSLEPSLIFSLLIPTHSSYLHLKETCSRLFPNPLA